MSSLLIFSVTFCTKCSFDICLSPSYDAIISHYDSYYDAVTSCYDVIMIDHVLRRF